MDNQGKLTIQQTFQGIFYDSIETIGIAHSYIAHSLLKDKGMKFFNRAHENLHSASYDTFVVLFYT